jgi:nicotinamidase-related amidase
MNLEEFFDTLDLDADSELSRKELHQVARNLRWHWREAPLYAVLDRLTVDKPLTREQFVSALRQIARDPYGPFGEVLENIDNKYPASVVHSKNASKTGRLTDSRKEIVTLLRNTLSHNQLEPFEQFLNELTCGCPPISTAESALLIIDPQRSFTKGAWKNSFGPGAEAEVRPIEGVFKNCAHLLKALNNRVETMFTRCPFPPDSYDWAEQIHDLIEISQVYFVKPGNSVMWPPTNGYPKWIDRLLRQGKTKLVMGGCTLNSCVRVSAIETYQFFSRHGLEVVVDLSISGARAGNYIRSAEYMGFSSVESAIKEMIESGVKVVRMAAWN